QRRLRCTRRLSTWTAGSARPASREVAGRIARLLDLTTSARQARAKVARADGRPDRPHGPSPGLGSPGERPQEVVPCRLSLVALGVPPACALVFRVWSHEG